MLRKISPTNICSKWIFGMILKLKFEFRTGSLLPLFMDRRSIGDYVNRRQASLSQESCIVAFMNAIETV